LQYSFTCNEEGIQLLYRDVLLFREDIHLFLPYIRTEFRYIPPIWSDILSLFPHFRVLLGDIRLFFRGFRPVLPYIRLLQEGFRTVQAGIL
jgi:hypothetical protein